MTIYSRNLEINDTLNIYTHFRSGYDEKSYTQHGDKEGHLRAHVCHPRLRLGWQFTRALDWPTLYLPFCVIYY